jgi:hypothetical protein
VQGSIGGGGGGSGNKNDSNNTLSIEFELLRNREKTQNDIDVACPICHNILMNPIACAQCLNHFCTSCIR